MKSTARRGSGRQHGATTRYLLSEEERCALVDMVRFDDVGAVVESFRNQLLLRLATAAVNALRYQHPQTIGQTDGPIDTPPPDHLTDIELAICFLPMDKLS